MDLTHCHGLGNDFLIVFDDVPEDGSDLARRLCNRSSGIGADGLIFGTPSSDGGWEFTLFNQDGSRAEVSGNGLRCFGHAVLRRVGTQVGVLDLAVDTVAGKRLIVVEGAPEDREVWAEVDMGGASSGPPFDGIDLTVVDVPIRQIGSVDLGNPHLVLIVDVAQDLDLDVVGPALEAFFSPVGCNVNFLTVVDRSTLQLRVWERGVGVTEACGSGACASAHLAYQWGLVDGLVDVVMPGGLAQVTVGDRLLLAGPSVHLADYVIDPSQVLTSG